jgi:hypothetical protein
MALNVTHEAQAGYFTTTGGNPYLYSSPSWCAFEAGRVAKDVPVKAKMSRGYAVKLSYRVGVRGTVDHLVQVDMTTGL